MFYQNTLHKTWCMSDVWAGMLLWWSCQSSVAHSWGLLNHPSSFCGGIFKLNAKFDADSLLYSLSHFERDSHTVHMLTEWCLPPPLTSTVKSSLFTHVHSSPLSLAARLHWCHANHSHILMLDRLFLDRPLYVIVIFLEARTLGKFLWKKEETLKKKETN